MPLVSISDAPREPLPWVNWRGTVFHGLPTDLYTCRDELGEYLAFLGRISTEKRVDRAIEIARRAGTNLKIAAKLDNVDLPYFRGEIEPLLRRGSNPRAPRERRGCRRAPTRWRGRDRH